jgi:hypothetical protein
MPWLVLVGLSSYSLFSHHCPESAIYRDNDQELAWGSNHYQRVVFNIIISLALLAYERLGLASNSDSAARESACLVGCSPKLPAEVASLDASDAISIP